MSDAKTTGARRNPSDILVTTAWLAERLGRPDIGVVDASWYLPTEGRDAVAEYRRGHVPGAVFLDIDEVADKSSGLPHMLPSEAQLGAAMGALGIAETMTIVVYDGAGLFSAPRAWWMLRIFGAERVHILDGGLPAWKAEGRPIETTTPRPKPARFMARLEPGRVVDLPGVTRALAGAATVVDARSGARFRGEAPEPRPGVRSGHMPGARNVPVAEVVENGRLASPARIAEAFEAAGVDLDRPLVTSCGSGVTAATLALAVESIGKPPPALYDGSWAEWGVHGGTPVATGGA